MAIVDGEAQRKIDQEIKQRMKAIAGHPFQIQKRIVELQLNPNETIRRIKQINGLLIEIHREIREF